MTEQKQTELRGSGAALITAERKRQVKKEKWTSKHDDNHADGELIDAALCYVQAAAIPWCKTDKEYQRCNDYPPDEWPFDEKDWKPKNPIQDLVRAGALIAAEIDRLKRKARNEHR